MSDGVLRVKDISHIPLGSDIIERKWRKMALVQFPIGLTLMYDTLPDRRETATMQLGERLHLLLLAHAKYAKLYAGLNKLAAQRLKGLAVFTSDIAQRSQTEGEVRVNDALLVADLANLMVKPTATAGVVFASRLIYPGNDDDSAVKCLAKMIREAAVKFFPATSLRSNERSYSWIEVCHNAAENEKA